MYLSIFKTNLRPYKYIFGSGDTANEIKKPQPLNVEGLISAPRKFYEARKDLTRFIGKDGPVPYFERQNTYVLHSLTERKISLVYRNGEGDMECIAGSLDWSPEFLAFFSEGLTFTPEELLNLFIKYRYCLRYKEQATMLISELRNLKFSANEGAKKAKKGKGPQWQALVSMVKRLGKRLRFVNKQSQSQSPDLESKKGNALEIFDKPKVFFIVSFYMPIFKGEPHVHFDVEIYSKVAADYSVKFTLESPEIPFIIQASILERFNCELRFFREEGFAVLPI